MRTEQAAGPVDYIGLSTRLVLNLEKPQRTKGKVHFGGILTF